VWAIAVNEVIALWYQSDILFPEPKFINVVSNFIGRLFQKQRRLDLPITLLGAVVS
jgi:hypothetical protein